MTSVIVEADGETELPLRAAVLFYKGADHVYASSHPVLEVEGRPQIGPGTPLAKGALSTLIDALSGATSFSGYVPPQVLYTMPGLLAWWSPPASRRVWFQTGKPIAADQDEDVRGMDQLGSKAGVALHPGLVFAATGKRWFVRAVAGADRPTPDTPLLVAPYFNVWDSSEICTGNVKLPQRLDAGTTKQYESAFFRSRFTHPNMTDLVKYREGPYAFWAHLIDGRFASFPEQHMHPAKQTLGAWIKSIKERKS